MPGVAPNARSGVYSKRRYDYSIFVFLYTGIHTELRYRYLHLSTCVLVEVPPASTNSDSLSNRYPLLWRGELIMYIYYARTRTNLGA